MSVTHGGQIPLNAENLAVLGRSLGPEEALTAVDVPTYDRSALRPSIVHIGVGGFHRAHLAVYVDQLCRGGSEDWAIVGAGILPGDRTIADVLSAQDHLYSLVVRGPDEISVQVVGAMVDYIHVHPDPAPLIERIAHPDTAMVSLTITEGGYPVDDETGRYDADSPLAGPTSAFGILAAGLELRRNNDLGPLTIVSCDNIVSNGAVTRTATVGAARQRDPELARWVGDEVAFPNSMVDRITPATSDADRQWLTEQTGMIDRWPVVTEPFIQWVLEDDFAGRRPPLEELGVIMTDDVEPYEQMKLQLLNAGHSCLAYLAALMGYEFVHDAMADATLRRFVDRFLSEEAGPVVPPVPGIDLSQYRRSLIERFSNPAIADQIARLCLDGSAKFPKFLLPTVRSQLAVDGPVELSAIALAGWCLYLRGRAEDGSTIELSADPNLDLAIRYAERAADDPKAFLEFSEVFGTDLVANARFVTAFDGAVNRLASFGVVESLSSALRDTAR